MSRDYDFLDVASQISQYCIKNQIPSRTAGRIQLVFEELVHQTLIPALKIPDIVTIVEYSEAEQSVTMTISYKGPQLDIMQTGDDLPLSLIKGMTSGIAYEERPAQEYTNRLTVII